MPPDHHEGNNNGREHLDFGPLHLVARSLVPVLVTIGALVVMLGPVATLVYFIYVHDPRSVDAWREIEQHAADDAKKFAAVQPPIVNCSNEDDAARWFAALRPDQQNYLVERDLLPIPQKYQKAAEALRERDRIIRDRVRGR